MVVLTQQVRPRKLGEEFPAGIVPNAAVGGFSSAHLLPCAPAVRPADLSATAVMVRDRDRQNFRAQEPRRTQKKYLKRNFVQSELPV